VKPQARVLATDRGITWVEVDYDELRGIESRELRLF
jgi:RecB family endonuclease NucS